MAKFKFDIDQKVKTFSSTKVHYVDYRFQDIHHYNVYVVRAESSDKGFVLTEADLQEFKEFKIGTVLLIRDNLLYTKHTDTSKHDADWMCTFLKPGGSDSCRTASSVWTEDDLRAEIDKGSAKILHEPKG